VMPLSSSLHSFLLFSFPPPFFSSSQAACPSVRPLHLHRLGSLFSSFWRLDACHTSFIRHSSLSFLSSVVLLFSFFILHLSSLFAFFFRLGRVPLLRETALRKG
jgi:hypothetical protein